MAPPPLKTHIVMHHKKYVKNPHQSLKKERENRGSERYIQSEQTNPIRHKSTVLH